MTDETPPPAQQKPPRKPVSPIRLVLWIAVAGLAIWYIVDGIVKSRG